MHGWIGIESIKLMQKPTHLEITTAIINKIVGQKMIQNLLCIDRCKWL